ncbi:hypothetical protein BFP97_03280 [Roseivirga sp. 4D4]|uniref:hypothetical protein n=1 Tax=Roseivirga sp. 4D4 TaxID=1889784 RepID=UPI000853A5DB|nr:hypothetical protein [Roseivirga sp. 4D4]OEK00586.1 hypothetical protein BFP97_03280 [Roseivirga sp. 4D4]
MRGVNKLVLAIAVLLLAASCNKKDVPQKDYFFTFKVKMSKKITEPTIINGYYGTMNLYKGDFSVSDSTNTKQPVPATYEILLFETSQKDVIDATSYLKDGKLFYDLKKIKKAKVEAKFIITPNKSGFYQFDPNDADYLALICINKRTGYYPGGMATLPSPNGSTRKLDMRVDYQATF